LFGTQRCACVLPGADVPTPEQRSALASLWGLHADKITGTPEC
jgi:hypothetical protein